MADALRDENFVTTLTGVSSDDGETVLNATIEPTTHNLEVEDGTTGTDLSDNVASRDQNFVPVAIAVSEDDGVTPVEIYINPLTGKLLVDSN